MALQVTERLGWTPRTIDDGGRPITELFLLYEEPGTGPPSCLEILGGSLRLEEGVHKSEAKADLTPGSEKGDSEDAELLKDKVEKSLPEIQWRHQELSKDTDSEENIANAVSSENESLQDSLPDSDEANEHMLAATPPTSTALASPRMPQDIEAILRILATSSSLSIPRLYELWQHRIQLSTALAHEVYNPDPPHETQKSVGTFELSSVVTLRDDASDNSVLDPNRLALALDAELAQPESWYDIAEKYGRALHITGSSQEVDPAYLIVFRNSGKVYGMTGSILGYERALKAHELYLRASNQAPKPHHLEALANIHLKKFERWGGEANIEKAIECYRSCLSETEIENVKYVDRVTGLCHVLQLRAILLRKMADVDEARRLLDQIEKTALSRGEQDSSKYRSTLSLVKFASWAICKDPPLYDDAVSELVDVSRSGTANPMFLNGTAYYMRILLLDLIPKASKFSHVLQDLAGVLLKVLASMAVDNPTRFNFCKLAADFHLRLYDSAGDRKYGLVALALYDDMYMDVWANPEQRIHAAYHSAFIRLTLNGDAETACRDMREAYRLIPEAVSEGLARRDQLQVLRRLWYIPAFTVAVALTAGTSAETALRLLEQGRAVIWDHFLNRKTSLTELEERHTLLARQYKNLRSRLEGSESLVLKSQSAELDARHYASRFQDLLVKIRLQNGFQDFLQLPRDMTGLGKLGADGPVIAINVSTTRSDAIIINQSGIMSFQLQGVTSPICDEKIISFRSAIAQITINQLKANNILAPILKWLWKAIVEPILNYLGYFPNTGDLPHIWWLTTGPIGILPLHAAGDHRRASQTGVACTLLDRAICSYVPTLRALEFARKRQQGYVMNANREHRKQVLLLSMEKTPNMADPKFATQEARRVQEMFMNKHMQDRMDIIELARPRCKEVIKALQSCTVAHFACHAKVDEEDPSKSHLRLQDWGSSPLEVSTLMELNLSQCQLVYLSACETAVNKDLQLREGGIHISGGFQMAGVPNAIATWWKIEDRYPIYVTTGFYKGLIKDGTLDFSKCAVSLREAVLKLRNFGIDPLVWGAYIHFGV